MKTFEDFVKESPDTVIILQDNGMKYSFSYIDFQVKPVTISKYNNGMWVFGIYYKKDMCKGFVYKDGKEIYNFEVYPEQYPTFIINGKLINTHSIYSYDIHKKFGMGVRSVNKFDGRFWSEKNIISFRHNICKKDYDEIILNYNAFARKHNFKLIDSKTIKDEWEII
jgi:hypothetical protein